MPSDLQKAARGLVDCLNEVPAIAAHLQRTAARCRENADLALQVSGGGATMAAQELYAAAQKCEEAAHYLTLAPPKAKGWAERAIGAELGGTRQPGSGSASRNPLTTGGPDAGDDRSAVRAAKDMPRNGTGLPERRQIGDTAEPPSIAAPELPDDFEQKAIEILTRLPVRKATRSYSPKTRGIWMDDDGTEHDLISGRHDPEFEEAQRHAERLGLVDPPSILSTAADVELKFAMRMRRDGIRSARIVLNNRPCPGDLGCNKLLPSFLPPGSQLTVYGPSGFKHTYYGKTEPE
jgi:nucleic acid/nucleotide deaminase of polymorphic system toxin